MQIKSRLFLVSLLVSSQAACLIFGVIWATGWLWAAFESVVNSHVVAEGQAQTHQLALKIAELQLNSVEPGTHDWWRLQELCEDSKIVHDGFMCVMRPDNGAMLCHPKLAENPSLLEVFPGRQLLMNKDSAAPIIDLIQRANTAEFSIVSGKVELDGDLHVVTSTRLPALDAVLAVYQSDTAIEQFIASTIRPVMQVGYALTAFIVGATAILTVFLINRYEAGLAEANARLEKQVRERTQSLLRTRNAVVFGLAKLAESRDCDTGEHLERIRSYVTILATEMAKTHTEIDRHYVADLAVASSLHDIGKVGVPDAILLKPGRLDETERHTIEQHTVMGNECLQAVQKQLEEDDFLELARQIAIGHHEHWDGNGYPQRLQGNDIPLSARIVALADCYDALTTVRPYKKAFPHVEAREWIVSRYATQFDPVVVEAFVAREEDFIRTNISYNGLPQQEAPQDASEANVVHDAKQQEEEIAPH
jgi:putative two-component system response regulator